MSVPTVENNNLESIVFSKINSLFDLEVLLNEPSPRQIIQKDNYKIQLEAVEIDDKETASGALLTIFEVNQDGSIADTLRFRVEIDLEEKHVKTIQTEDGYQSLNELNNQLTKIYG